MADSALNYVGKNPFDAPNGEALVDVIFVHGLGGDPIESWSATKDPEGFWPHWLALDFLTANVWTVGYQSQLFAPALSGEGGSLKDRATALLDLLTSKNLGKRPIVFITHSLGGLIVKQMLRLCSDQIIDTGKRILAQTRAVVFCATPHAGSQLATNVNSVLKLAVTKHVKTTHAER